MNQPIPSSDFLHESELPKKTREKLMRMLRIHAPLFMTDDIKSQIGEASAENFKMFCDLLKRSQWGQEKLKEATNEELRSDFNDQMNELNKMAVDHETQMLDVLTDHDRDFINHTYNLIAQDIIQFFSELTLPEQLTLSQKKRKERVKQARKHGVEPFTDIPLRPYLNHFIGWLCNEGIEKFDNKIGWPREDWDSDAISIIRGYLISKNKNQGKAQFRLEDFEFINNIYGEVSHITYIQCKGIKPVAAEFIPAEGADFVRASFAIMPDIDQSKLPTVWQNDEGNAVELATDINEPPQADILHADDHYILMHLKNESAAKCFGSNPSWCVTYGHWDTYSDNFLFICDAEGYRYGINLRENQCVDQNDLTVLFSDISKKYDGLETSIQNFYQKQLKQAIINNDLFAVSKLVLPWGLMHVGGQDFRDLVLTSYDPSDIKSATLEMSKRTHSKWVHSLFDVYRGTEKTRQYFVDNDFIRLPFELYRRGLVENSTLINCAISGAERHDSKLLRPIIQEEINELATYGHKHQAVINNMVEFNSWLEMPKFPKPKTLRPSSPSTALRRP